jgi:hypothetical protein
LEATDARRASDPLCLPLLSPRLHVSQSHIHECPSARAAILTNCSIITGEIQGVSFAKSLSYQSIRPRSIRRSCVAEHVERRATQEFEMRQKPERRLDPLPELTLERAATGVVRTNVILKEIKYDVALPF